MKILGFEITRLKKIAYSSGGGDAYTSPQPWQTAMLGPGQPIYPVTPAADTELPRSIDYPISVNAQLTPRSGYGLLPFGILSNTYEKVPECRNPVLLIHRQLSSFKPRLVDKKNNVVNDHPMQWMCEYPDGSTPFSVWMTRYIKSTKIYDAPALYFERTRANEITGLHFIDGSTLFVILDEWGNTPKAESVEEYVQRQSYSFEERESQPLVPGSVAGPTTLNSFVEYYNRRLQEGKPVPAKVPAYTQVIKGTPFAWWSADDIWYMPESKRVNSPYGEPFIEAAWVWVNIIVNLVTFELAHYRTGNMPEGFVTLPKDWLSTPDQVEALERAYNARMSSNPATERNRLRFFPDGSKYIPTKRNSWEQALYERANQVIRDAIGVPSAETGDMPGEGLGGKGMKEANTTELNRNTMNPNRNTIMTPFNFALRNNGVTDVTFSLDAPVDEIDPDKLKASVYEGMTRGTYTLNDALAQLNMQPVGDPNDENNIANKHLIVAGQGIYVVEDMEVANGMAVPAQFQGADQAGGVPAGPETAMGNPEHTPEDQQTLQQFIKRVERGEPISGKKYFTSYPLTGTMKKYNENHDEAGRFASAPGGGGGGGRKDPDATATAPKEVKKPFQPPSKKPKKAEGPVRNDAGPFHIDDAKEAQDPNPVMMEPGTKPTPPKDRLYKDHGYEGNENLAKKRGAAERKDLSPKEKKVFKDYAFQGSMEINGYLRADFTDWRADIMNDAIKRSPGLPEDTLLHRGVSVVPEGIKAGQSFTEKGFSSTSYSSGVAEGFGEGKLEGGFKGKEDLVRHTGAVFHIKAPKGTKGIHGFGHDSSEQEFILPSNTSYHIDYVSEVGPDNKVHIYAHIKDSGE